MHVRRARPVFKMHHAARAACSVRGLSDSELEDLAGKLDEQVEANIGMVRACFLRSGRMLCGQEAQGAAACLPIPKPYSCKLVEKRIPMLLPRSTRFGVNAS